MDNLERLLDDLPDPDAANRFLYQFSEKFPRKVDRLTASRGFLSDVLTLVSYSPLLATTLLQNPEHLSWLDRERSATGVRSKDQLLESLARFSLTNSQVEPNIMIARFRRRELMRIFLKDIRRLATIAEITEELSNLADAILEYAMRLVLQDLDNRFGSPLETDDKGRKRRAECCIVSLGKLGSKELNYSSDIDLLFLYSAEGTTAGGSSERVVTNREYFVKLAEGIIKLVGHQTGEGAAYRVDLRLRPHGRVGPLALTVGDAARYYLTEARSWERQVLIRSRAAAGEIELFRDFFARVENAVFSPDETVENALRNVRLSKQTIDLSRRPVRGYDVKLDRGGIRDIEFVAQALQLAYGGRDRWLRAPHTLISLSRLADRKLITEAELTALFEAYEFLRRLEHILQMENGLQTHLLPENTEKRALVARRMGYAGIDEFQPDLDRHRSSVTNVFQRVLGQAESLTQVEDGAADPTLGTDISARETNYSLQAEAGSVLLSPRLAELLRRHPRPCEAACRDEEEGGWQRSGIFLQAVESEDSFGGRLAALRRGWQERLAQIVRCEIDGEINWRQAKRRQTALAEASIQAAIRITELELAGRFNTQTLDLRFAVLGLGKIGGGGLDYDSDLDLVLIYDDTTRLPEEITPAEFYGRAAEIFVTALSGVTREGSLYRVDLRLRPYGKNGPSATSREAFYEYMQRTAAVWEMLAYVKLRAVGGNLPLAKAVEDEIRALIHRRAAEIDPKEIAREAREIRLQLEKQRSRTRRGGEIDIKYGPGGMLDIYFAMRYIQLRDDVPDDPDTRSTDFMLWKLREAGSLRAEDHAAFLAGYEYLSRFDHYLRLTIGRTTRVPIANRTALEAIAVRMNLASADELLERLNLHRLDIRTAFDKIFAA